MTLWPVLVAPSGGGAGLGRGRIGRARSVERLVHVGGLGAWSVSCARNVTRARRPCIGCPSTSTGVVLPAPALVGEQPANDLNVPMRRRLRRAALRYGAGREPATGGRARRPASASERLGRAVWGPGGLAQPPREPRARPDSDALRSVGPGRCLLGPFPVDRGPTTSVGGQLAGGFGPRWQTARRRPQCADEAAAEVCCTAVRCGPRARHRRPR